jgi:hypothetical protein
MEKFNLNKVKEVEIKEQYHLKISDRFAALEKEN